MFSVSELQSIIAKGSRNISFMEIAHSAVVAHAREYKGMRDHENATKWYNKAQGVRENIIRASQHQKKFKTILKEIIHHKDEKPRKVQKTFASGDPYYTITPIEQVLSFDATMKHTNPKDAIGSSKLPIHLWPNTATAMGCIGMLNGMLKYGRSNFRNSGIRASIYVDAAKRHIDAWFEGEEVDPDDGVPHLSAALACLAIIVDSNAAGLLTDDRMVKGGYRDLVTELTPHVERLKQLHSTKNPKHFTIADNL